MLKNCCGYEEDKKDNVGMAKGRRAEAGLELEVEVAGGAAGVGAPARERGRHRLVREQLGVCVERKK